MFEYYFIVTYVDGTIVDIPAGKSAFIPAAVGDHEEQGTQEKEIKMVDDRPEWDDHRVPECVSCLDPLGMHWLIRVGSRIGFWVRCHRRAPDRHHPHRW